MQNTTCNITINISAYCYITNDLFCLVLIVNGITDTCIDRWQAQIKWISFSDSSYYLSEIFMLQSENKKYIYIYISLESNKMN